MKEVRKARKEAFKSSSAVLKLQETLRDTQKRLQVSKIDHATDVQKADRFEQEATDSKCALIALQQDLGKLQEQFKVLEQEKEALKVNLKEEEVARIAAEGQIALPPAQGEDDTLFESPQKSLSPKKSQRSPLSDDKENSGVVTKKMVESRRLQEEVDYERRKREAAEDMVEFLRMECAFKCCDCATAAKHGRALKVAMDDIVASSIQRMKTDIATILTPPTSECGEDRMDIEHEPSAAVEQPAEAAPVQEQIQRELEDVVIDHDNNKDEVEEDDSVTLAAEDTPDNAEGEVSQAAAPTPAPLEQDEEQMPAQQDTETEDQGDAMDEDHETEETHKAVTVPLKDSPPSTPPRANASHENDQCPHSVRTITTTTRIPMHFTPVSKPPIVPFSEDEITRPKTSDGAIDDSLPFDREAALAAIAYRRGRARSMANGTLTPRKQMVEGINARHRRDISAPVIGAKTKSYAQETGSVGRSAGKVLRA